MAVTPATRWDLRVACEDLLYVGAHAYEAITGKSLYDVDVPEPEAQHYLGHGPAGDDWDFDDEGEMRRRYSKLWARLGLDKFR